MTDPDTNIQTEARERVLAAAERLFAQRGYAAVTLRDIAAAVGIRHTSLYHHAPGGKEELFVEVTERNLRRHKAGLQQAIARAAPDVRARLRAAAEWLLSQPPMDLIRMTHSDMPAIDPREAGRLSMLAYESMLVPFDQILRQARATGEIAHPDVGVVAGGLLGMIESLHAVPPTALDRTRESMAHDLIDVMLNGLRPRVG
jgi:AcrR family transcriptional regulator